MSKQQAISTVVRSLLRDFQAFLSKIRGLAGICFQLLILFLVIYQYKIEADFGLPRLLSLLFVGFIINAVIPSKFRLPFFVFLSLISIVAILGLVKGLTLIVIGISLISLAHLPVSYLFRILFIGSYVGILACIRAGLIHTPWPSLRNLIIPLIAAMFMFRLIIYLYDIRHEKTRSTMWERLGYFFMVPNVCFLLFPVIDYQTFRRSYYNESDITIYQKGILWIFRGTLHLLLYRIVYLELLPSPAEVQTLENVVIFMVMTYLLYLRISGLFHLAIGILCLFGFNLPETHHLYFFASSFTDYWRRINIYWKDFMMKVFYYPSFTFTKKWGFKPGLIFSTIVVFVATWFLHGYQWFWLKGKFPVSLTDILFWSILGSLVVFNTQREVNTARKRALNNPEFNLKTALIHSIQVIGMFLFLTGLWTLWSSPNISYLLEILRPAANFDYSSLLLITAVLLLVIVSGIVIQYLDSKGWFTKNERKLDPRNIQFRPVIVIVSIFLIGVSHPKITNSVNGKAESLLASVREMRLNEQDAEKSDRGYYEELLVAEKYTSALATNWKKAEMPDDWIDVRRHDVSRVTGDYLEYELKPSYSGTFKRSLIQTNKWGMRDKEYQLKKPQGVFRIALLGSSYEMGAGVSNEMIYESVLEENLNRSLRDGGKEKYEFLNFSVGGYSLLQHTFVTEKKLFPFQPDIVLLTAHTSEKELILRHLTETISTGKIIPFPEINEIIIRSGAKRGMPASAIERHLKSHIKDVIHACYQRIAENCRRNSAIPVWVFLPRTHDPIHVGNSDKFHELQKEAQSAGFVTLFLGDVYADYEYNSIRVAEWDDHPNKLGHELIADALLKKLQERIEVFNLGLLARTEIETTEISYKP